MRESAATVQPRAVFDQLGRVFHTIEAPKSRLNRENEEAHDWMASRDARNVVLQDESRSWCVVPTGDVNRIAHSSTLEVRHAPIRSRGIEFC
jgi:hypothetical protein